MADMLDIIRNLECLRCGTREILLPYNLSYSKVVNTRRINKRTTQVTYRVHSIPVPICIQCQEEFKKWDRGKKLLIVLGVAGFFLFWLGLWFFIMSRAMGEPFFLQLIAFILGIVIIAVDIILYIFHKKKDSNSNNYMSMKSDLVPYVKPKNQGWIKYEDWIQSFFAKPILPTNVSYPGDAEIRRPEASANYDMIIYQYLKQNVGKAFTVKALVSRILKRLPKESDKEYLINNIESILNRLALQKRINKVQRNEQFYYSVT